MTAIIIVLALGLISGTVTVLAVRSVTRISPNRNTRKGSTPLMLRTVNPYVNALIEALYSSDKTDRTENEEEQNHVSFDKL